MKNNKTEILILTRCCKEETEAAKGSLIFKNWLKKLSKKLVISSIEITAVNFHSPTASAENVLFVRLYVRTEDTNYGQVVELRGNTSAMLVNLTCKENGKVYTVLVQQKRIPTGNCKFVEIPAGMVDHDTFKGTASKEIKEELGLEFDHSEIHDITGIPLSRPGIYLSPGLLDESCRFYVAEREVSSRLLNKMKRQTFGVAEKGEHIKLVIVPLNDIPKFSCDAKTLLALSLFQNYRMNKHATPPT